jgi:cbb3-type cytochrome oxidase subunit 3
MLHSFVHSILRHLGGVQQYGVVSMCLFSSIFIGVLIWAFLQKKSHLDYMARAALDDEMEHAPRASTIDPQP